MRDLALNVGHDHPLKILLPELFCDRGAKRRRWMKEVRWTANHDRVLDPVLRQNARRVIATDANGLAMFGNSPKVSKRSGRESDLSVLSRRLCTEADGNARQAGRLDEVCGLRPVYCGLDLI